MAISLIASYFVNSSGQIGTAIATPSFTPSNGEIIVVKLATWATSTAMGIPVGGSQTYTSRVINAPGGFNEWCGIYTAVISGSPGSMTVSSTPAASARFSMTVERWSGAQLAATPVTNSNAGIGSVAQSTMTPSAGTSIISWVSGDAQSVDPATKALAGSGTSEGVRDDHVGTNGVDYYGYQSSTGTGSQTYGLTAPTGQSWVIAGIEIQASPSTAAFVPQNQARRRLQPPRRRQRVQPPVRAQVNPPFPFNQVKQPREPRGLLPKRGRASMPVPPQVVIVAPNFVPLPVRARLRGLRLFRGRASGPVPPQVVTPPAYPPQPVRGRVRGLRLPRGRSSSPPVDQAAPLGPQRRRFRLPKLFRGRISQPAPPQAAVIPPPYPPQSVRPRLRGLRMFRGRTGGPVPDQVVVAAPPYAPQSVRARLRFLRAFRSRTATVVPPQIVATPPAYVPPNVRARVRGLRLFRGRSSGVFPPQIVVQPPAYVPQAVRSRLRWLRWLRPRAAFAPVEQIILPVAPRVRPHPMAPRRTRSASPPMPQPVAPPAYPPQPVRSRLKGLRPARSRSAGPTLAQVILIAPAFPPSFARFKKRVARMFRGASWLVPFTDTTPVVQPRTPTVTVDLGRATAAADLSRSAAVADASRSAAATDLGRITATSDLTRPSTTVAL